MCDPITNSSRQAAACAAHAMIAAVAAVMTLTPAAPAQPTFDWSSAYCFPGMDETIYALTVFDDGHGPALYAGGYFETAGRTFANAIARWDGRGWSPLGSGIDPFGGTSVHALAVFDDGDGAALYVAGYFATAGGVSAASIARWDGTSWSAVDSGVGERGRIYALAVFDDGTGPALYAGGRFAVAGGHSASNVAKWDGASWSALGDGVTGKSASVQALAVADDGTGPALFVGGRFEQAGDVSARNLAKWDGVEWSEVGGGIAWGSVNCLATFDDGSGAALYVGGEFGYIGELEVHNIARWDGARWSALGTGTSGAVLALAEFDGGDGPALIAGGEFSKAGGADVNRVAEWDGANWKSMSGGVLSSGRSPLPRVAAFAAYDAGDGAVLYAAGSFKRAGSTSASAIAGWNGHEWSSTSSGNAFDGWPGSEWVDAMCVFDGGDGPALYVSGQFWTIGGVFVQKFARWNGSTWSAVGDGLDGYILDFAVHDDGSGPALFAGGAFVKIDNVPLSYIGRWNGIEWETVGGGMGGRFPVVYGLCPFDDGQSAALYACGAFTEAGGISATRVARWDGSAWSALGEGIPGTYGETFAYTMAAFDDGKGPALYVGGLFNAAGDIDARNIARWDGTSWSEVGGGVNGPVYTLHVFDEGRGPALYVGGDFTVAGDLSVQHIARWDGTAWSDVGGGVSEGTHNTHVAGLYEFDDGRGPALYVAGQFSFAGDISANQIARWDGSQWSPLGNGLTHEGDHANVGAMTAFDDGTGPSLFMGGFFTAAGGKPSSNFACWAKRSPRGDLNCDGLLDFADIDPFVVALIGQESYENQYPDCDFGRGDVNCDDSVDFDDIDGFVTCIINGECDSCP